MAKKSRAGQVGTVKRSVTISDATDQAAHALVGDRGFSALVNQALEHELRRQRVFELLARLDEKYGPLTSEQIQEGEEAWRRLNE